MTNESHDNSESLGLSDLVVWLRNNWLPIIVSLVVCVVFGIVYSVITTPQYRVHALLAPQESSGSNQLLSQFGAQLGALGLGGVVGRDGTNQADVSTAILTSRQFLGGFIERRNLMPALFAARWDGESGAWRDDGDPPPSINDGYRKFVRTVLSVNRDELTGFVTVMLEWKDGQVAHDWLVVIIKDLNETVRERERQEARRSLQFLREELQRTEIVDLQQALNQLSLAELQRLTLANVREEFAFKIIDPPSVPDADDPVWPRFSLILLGSVFAGLFLGIFLAVVLTTARALPNNE